MIRLQRWESSPYSAAFSSRIPDTFVENVKICPLTSPPFRYRPPKPDRLLEAGFLVGRRSHFVPYVFPVLPNPLVPRSDSRNWSTSRKLARTTGTITNCAMRSIGAISNVVEPRFQSDTNSCPW
jgi:hypothetical protein